MPAHPGLTAVALDATVSSLVTEEAAGHDVVLSAISPPRDGSDPAVSLLATYRSLIEGLRTAGVRRLIAVGGAGSLKTASGQDRVDTPDFPAITRRRHSPSATAQSPADRGDRPRPDLRLARRSHRPRPYPARRRAARRIRAATPVSA
ncbi:hypothetical protein E1166_22805 [Micromonospora sp. KC213]|nr:hypothetical protein E1166_22805 [Micromonospora sp. KC213]